MNMDPHTANLAPNGDNLKRQMKAAIKTLYNAEYKQAMLDLEAEHKVLCLCSFHWKADHMLGQTFLR